MPNPQASLPPFPLHPVSTLTPPQKGLAPLVYCASPPTDKAPHSPSDATTSCTSSPLAFPFPRSPSNLRALGKSQVTSPYTLVPINSFIPPLCRYRPDLLSSSIPLHFSFKSLRIESCPLDSIFRHPYYFKKAFWLIHFSTFNPLHL